MVVTGEMPTPNIQLELVQVMNSRDRAERPRHDGRIEVQSEVGKGSTFTVYLPTYKEDTIRFITGLSCCL